MEAGTHLESEEDMLPAIKALYGIGIAGALAVATMACGGGGDDGNNDTLPNGGQGGADQVPSAQLEITSDAQRFDKDLLVAPPNQQVSIVYHNEDTGVLHNVSLYTNHNAKQPLHVGELFVGDETRTYRFQSPEPGSYFFRCDVHPDTMSGSFVTR
jgi:plastocyanin